MKEKLQNKQNLKKGLILTVFAGISWGFSGSCGQFLLNSKCMTPELITVLRMCISGPVLLLFTWQSNKEKYKELLNFQKDWLTLIFFATAGIFLSQYSYIKTISYTNAGTATILQYTGPILILLYMCISKFRTPTIIEITSILLTMVGIFLLATQGNINELVISRNGLLWGAIASFSLAAYTIIPRGILKRYGSAPVISFGMIISGFTAVLFLKWFNGLFPLSKELLFGLFGMIFLGTIISYWFFMEGVKLIGPIKASMIASIEPLSATIFSALWLGTKFSKMDLIGFTFIILTIFLLSLSEEKTENI